MTWRMPLLCLTPVTKWPRRSVHAAAPETCAVDAVGRQLLVTLHDVSAFAAAPAGVVRRVRSRHAAAAGRIPGSAWRADAASRRRRWIVAGMAASNGLSGQQGWPFLTAKGARCVRRQPFDGRPVVDARASGSTCCGSGAPGSAGERPRLCVGDGAVRRAMRRSTCCCRLTARSCTRSATATWLQETAALRSRGNCSHCAATPAELVRLRQTDFFRARFYPVPGSTDTAFVAGRRLR